MELVDEAENVYLNLFYGFSQGFLQPVESDEFLFEPEFFADAVTSIAHYYPDETTEVCRQALGHPNIQVGYFTYFDKAEALVFAIDILGKYGNGADLSLLRRYCDDSRLGRSAIEAIRKIEQRLVSV